MQSNPDELCPHRKTGTFSYTAVCRMSKRHSDGVRCSKNDIQQQPTRKGASYDLLSTLRSGIESAINWIKGYHRLTYDWLRYQCNKVLEPLLPTSLPSQSDGWWANPFVCVEQWAQVLGPSRPGDRARNFRAPMVSVSWLMSTFSFR